MGGGLVGFKSLGGCGLYDEGRLASRSMETWAPAGVGRRRLRAFLSAPQLTAQSPRCVLDWGCTWFECVSMLVILLNCVTLGMYQPCDDMDCLSDRCKILQVRGCRETGRDVGPGPGMALVVIQDNVGEPLTPARLGSPLVTLGWGSSRTGASVPSPGLSPLVCEATALDLGLQGLPGCPHRHPHRTPWRQPLSPAPEPHDVLRLLPPALQVFDDFIFIFFAMEMVLKMVALGIFGKKCYLGDTWNRLDLFIVVAG